MDWDDDQRLREIAGLLKQIVAQQAQVLILLKRLVELETPHYPATSAGSITVGG